MTAHKKSAAIAAPATIVVPCYNEANRLRRDGFVELLKAPIGKVLFVNDGSKDSTESELRALASTRPSSFSVLSLAVNGGKGEAVRAGLLEAIAQGASIVGYYDADLATPPDEMVRIVESLQNNHGQMAMGSRVALLGRAIDRKATRHYMGRVFATLASVALKLRVYDTQCGAKALLVTDALRHALSKPFRSRWAFDVELIGRLRNAGVPDTAFREVPLRTWRDEAGSTLRLPAMVKSVAELGLIALDTRRPE